MQIVNIINRVLPTLLACNTSEAFQKVLTKLNKQNIYTQYPIFVILQATNLIKRKKLAWLKKKR